MMVEDTLMDCRKGQHKKSLKKYSRPLPIVESMLLSWYILKQVIFRRYFTNEIIIVQCNGHCCC